MPRRISIKLTYEREDALGSGHKTQWGVFYQGEWIGSVVSLYSGGWKLLDGLGEYSTRHEAAIALYSARR